jgi:hypothetical protein
VRNSEVKRASAGAKRKNREWKKLEKMEKNSRNGF